MGGGRGWEGREGDGGKYGLEGGRGIRMGGQGG